MVHPNADAVASDTRLRDLEARAAYPKAIPDTHLIVWQALNREVLAELSVDKVRPFQSLLPVTVRLELIDNDRALLPPWPARSP